MQLTAHCLVTLSGSMYMLHRNSQCNKLIHKPCHIDLSFFFGNHNEVITFFSILMTELHHQLICRAYRLFHIIQAAVTRYPYHSIRLEVQFESTRCFLYNQRNINLTLLYFWSINVSKEKVIQYKLILTRVCLHAFQINFVFIKLSQSFFYLFGRQRYK